MSELGLRIILSAIIVVGGFSYVVITNSVTTSGLQVQDLSRRLNALSEQRSKLEIEVDRLQSLSRLDAVSKNLDLVKVSKVDYVTSPAGAVASR